MFVEGRGIGAKLVGPLIRLLVLNTKRNWMSDVDCAVHSACNFLAVKRRTRLGE